MNTSTDLLFLAGHRAYARIRDEGLSPGMVKMVVGASGAAKWLVLHGLESALFTRWFAGRLEPLHLFGTSIGAWKSVAAAWRDPQKGFDCLAQGYIQQRYVGKITRDQVARETARIMHAFLQPGIADEVLSHPFCHLHFASVRCRGPLGSDMPVMELAGLAGAWLLNRVSRRLLRGLCPPTLWYDGRQPPPFVVSDEFCGGQVQLSTENLGAALLASGSIPGVMAGVRDIAGAPPGVYRDGGLYHYHPAFDFLGSTEGIVLYPHFYREVTLGWLDKGRRCRVADGQRLADVLLLVPSAEFVATLPYGRIPDRHDFLRLQGRDAERIAGWQRAVTLSRRLGEAFLAATESGAIRHLVQRIS